MTHTSFNFLISITSQLHCPRKMPHFIRSTVCEALYHYWSLHTSIQFSSYQFIKFHYFAWCKFHVSGLATLWCIQEDFQVQMLFHLPERSLKCSARGSSVFCFCLFWVENSALWNWIFLLVTTPFQWFSLSFLLCTGRLQCHNLSTMLRTQRLGTPSTSGH